MQITILNGNSNPKDTSFEQYISQVTSQLESDHDITNIKLRKLKIKLCTGCFGCWVNTPGKCIFNDDTDMIRESYMRSDLVIFASPVIMGFTSALLKSAQDKLLPLLHPNFTLLKNEIHHKYRYKTYPLVGLIVSKEPKMQDNDISIITDIYNRIAINLNTSLSFSITTQSPVKELMYAVNNF
ncbi:MAG: flavodoxin family protein [Spirochaetes bacterium]|jgi:multimeric flavodoxin WrbA|nr:flavodoxin family protein [Spirochaetota bacterium]